MCICMALPRGAGLWNHISARVNIYVQQTITSAVVFDCKFAYIRVPMASCLFTGLWLMITFNGWWPGEGALALVRLIRSNCRASIDD